MFNLKHSGSTTKEYTQRELWVNNLLCIVEWKEMLKLSDLQQA